MKIVWIGVFGGLVKKLAGFSPQCMFLLAVGKPAVIETAPEEDDETPNDRI